MIAIAVPAYYQANLIKKCINYNKKIFCEKPIVVDYKLIRNIYSYAKNSKKRIIVDYIFQKHEAFKKFKNLIPKPVRKNAKVNIIFKTQCFNNKNKIKNWKNNPKLGGGIINLYLPHIIAYIIFFFGSISVCKKITKNKNFLKIQYILKNGITWFAPNTFAFSLKLFPTEFLKDAAGGILLPFSSKILIISASPYPESDNK